jgi:hypothetical protein
MADTLTARQPSRRFETYVSEIIGEMAAYFGTTPQT